MRLLAQVPGSVLWVKQPGEKTKANLVAAAKTAGIDPVTTDFRRHGGTCPGIWRAINWPISFSTPCPITPIPRVATPCGPGLPLLTQRGTAFAGRVCASLLTALELPALIAETAHQYESTALRAGA